jgi:hypothetical protein
MMITMVPVGSPGSTCNEGVTPWSRRSWAWYSASAVPTAATKSTGTPSEPSQTAVLAAEPPGLGRIVDGVSVL